MKLKIKLVKEMSVKEYLKELENEYGSMDNLQKLIEKEPDNYVFKLALEDWNNYLEDPTGTVKQTNIKIILTDSSVRLNDFELVNVIRTSKPKSVRNLAQIMDADLSNIQKRVKRLEEEGLISLKEGPKHSKIPIVNYNKIEIEV